MSWAQACSRLPERTCRSSAGARLPGPDEGLALETGVPAAFGVFSYRKMPHTGAHFATWLTIPLRPAARCWCRGQPLDQQLLSFESTLPFDKAPVWSEIRKLPLAEQEAALRNPAMRAKLVEAARRVHD